MHAFDPTPSSARWVAAQSLPAAFHFHDWGIGGEDGSALFYPPANDAHMSFSNAPGAAQPGTPVSAPILRLATILGRLGHDRIDLLKMDVEGFEYETLRDIEASNIRPDQLLVEFHHGMYQATDADTNEAVARLGAMGYDLYFVSDTGREYGFVKR